MNGPVPVLRPCGDDLPALVALLAEAGLPHADLAAHLGHVVVAERAGETVGAGGFDDCGGGIGLLRSFVVRSDLRGQGLGRRLYRAVLAEARRAGLTELYLLTTTARDWFAGLGFETMPRETAPAAIRATCQYAELCPANSTLMHLDLARADAAGVALAGTDREIAACYPVMRELRPQVAEADFVPRVRAQMAAGYRLAYVQGKDGTVVAVAGFRIGHNLAWGRFLYVDDLVTLTARRSAGHGAHLLAWLRRHAVAEGCAQVHLDSGVQRIDAHRFYEREGLVRTSFHFSIDLTREGTG